MCILKQETNLKILLLGGLVWLVCARMRVAPRHFTLFLAIYLQEIFKNTTNSPNIFIESLFLLVAGPSQTFYYFIFNLRETGTLTVMTIC